MLEKLLENIREWLSVNKRALRIEKTQAINVFKNQGEKLHLSDSIIGRNNCVNYLGVLFDEQINFSYHIAEVVAKISQFFSVTS